MWCCAGGWFVAPLYIVMECLPWRRCRLIQVTIPPHSAGALLISGVALACALVELIQALFFIVTSWASPGPHPPIQAAARGRSGGLQVGEVTGRRAPSAACRPLAGNFLSC